jgi:hypothetical protein
MQATQPGGREVLASLGKVEQKVRAIALDGEAAYLLELEEVLDFRRGVHEPDAHVLAAAALTALRRTFALTHPGH